MRALTYGYAAYAMYARRTLLFHGGRSARKGGPPAPPCRTRPHRKLEAPYKRHYDEVLMYRNIHTGRQRMGNVSDGRFRSEAYTEEMRNI